MWLYNESWLPRCKCSIIILDILMLLLPVIGLCILHSLLKQDTENWFTHNKISLTINIDYIVNILVIS